MSNRHPEIIERLCKTLDEAAGWFEEYDRIHRAKATPDGHDKAATNRVRAKSLRAAASHAREDAA